MQTYGQLVHSEEFARDGVHYRIAVVRVQGGLHGEWSCDHCDVTDQNGVHPFIEEAVEGTKKLIDRHHGERHRR